jgi:hypothetical protein
MKKKFLYLSMLLFATLLATSCGKDDDDAGNIVGAWKFDDVKVVNFKVNGQSIPAVYIREMENSLRKEYKDIFGDVLDFTSDGKMYVNGEYDGTYKVSGNKLTMYEDGETYKTTYSVKNDQLRVSLDMTQYPEIKEEGITKCDVDLIFIKQNKSGLKSAPASASNPMQKVTQTVKELIIFKK